MELFYTYISLLITLLLSLLLLKGFFLGWFTERKKKRYHPISSTVFHQLFNFERLHHYHTDLALRHKTFRLFAIGYSEIYTADPANVEYILKTNFSNYAKGTYHYDILSGLLGDGIFAVDGEKWRHQRKIASYEFSTKVLRDSSSVVFRRNAAKLAHIVSDAATSNREMDMQDLFMKSTLDSIFKVGFGTELNSLYGTSEEGSRFAEAFDESSVLTFWRYVDPLWKLKKRFNIGSEAMLQKKKKGIDEFVYKLIRSKKEQISGQQDSMEKEDILSRFLALSHEDPENMNDRYLRDIILNFIIAGKDTTALTLSWFVYLLSKNSVVQGKIAQEVKEATHAQDSTSIDEFTTSISEEALSKMHYLHAALTETLRLYPPVPVVAFTIIC